MPETIHRQITLELEERKGETPSTVSATLSSEAPVRRSLWGEVVTEVLRHDESSIDLSRARPSLPLIISHDQRTLPVGVIEGIRLDGRKLRGTVRFGQSPRAQEVARDVADRIITGISIGYSIERFADTTNKDGSTTRTATRWTPHEASVVAIPADTAAGFGRGKTMPEIENTELTNNSFTVEQVRAQELERCKNIRTLCHVAKLGDSFADDLIRSGESIDAARSRVLDKLIAEEPDKSHGVNSAATGRDLERRDLYTSGARDNVTDRRAEIIKDVVAGRLGSIELARSIVLQRGEQLPRNHNALISRAMSTSDFPQILTGAVGASLRNGYEVEPASHRAWVRVESVPDFKLQERPILGAAPDLKLKIEGGEYTLGALDEDGTSYKVATYGRRVKLTRETLVNDNLGAFLRLLPAMGQAAARKEADLVYSMFAENGGDGPDMQDGNPLFDATIHKNLTGPGAFGVNALSAARLLLRKQTSVGGGYLAIRPATLIVPAEEEHTAELLLAAASRVIGTGLESDVTPWIKDLKMVVEPRLPATAAYLAGDSAQIDSAVLGMLDGDGQDGPFLEEWTEPETDDRNFKVRHDIGAKFLDWRGIVKIAFGGEE